MKKLLATTILTFGISQLSQAASLQPRQVVEQYFANLAEGNISALMNLLDDNVVWHQPGSNILSGTYVGKTKVGELFTRFMEISGGTFRIDEVHNIMTNGAWVSASLSFSAKRCRYFEVSMQMSGVDVMRIEDGKIKEVFLFSESQDEEDNFWGK